MSWSWVLTIELGWLIGSRQKGVASVAGVALVTETAAAVVAATPAPAGAGRKALRAARARVSEKRCMIRFMVYLLGD
jgi:hypothetical protein